MKNFEETYVSAELAQLLKDKGFEASTTMIYTIKKKTFSSFQIPCPTIALAARFLREKYHILINAKPYIDRHGCYSNMKRHIYTQMQYAFRLLKSGDLKLAKRLLLAEFKIL